MIKLKHGSGRSAGYRFVTAEELESLRRVGRIVVETRRYGNVYAVDRKSLDEARQRGAIPVTHIGNLADMRRLLAETPSVSWLRVLLWVPRSECEKRSLERGDLDTAERLAAWDQTSADVLDSDVKDLFDMVIRTDRTDPTTAAKEISGERVRTRDALRRDELEAALALPRGDGAS
ncbi:guanylate kinase [Streptomyces sp. NBC_00247]|uniref:guanylate kinase n=1 Tax=Streptomyces sp. NBC_00247 TaxID=2975689 RepID=UPI002E2DE228|nr:guanylate kinase [Streptomyces sp. NBC_00247]